MYPNRSKHDRTPLWSSACKLRDVMQIRTILVQNVYNAHLIVTVSGRRVGVSIDGCVKLHRFFDVKTYLKASLLAVVG